MEGSGRARPTGLAAAVPSSLGSHLQVPQVQSFQGPAGEGKPTPAPGRGLRASTSVELRTPPSPCQLAVAQVTFKAALIRACPSWAIGRAISLCPQVVLYPLHGFGLYTLLELFCRETKLYVPSQYLCHQLPPEMPTAQSRAAATWELRVDVVKGPPGDPARP